MNEEFQTIFNYLCEQGKVVCELPPFAPTFTDLRTMETFDVSPSQFWAERIEVKDGKIVVTLKH